MATRGGSTRGGPSEKELLELSCEVTPFWYNLGIRLGLSSATLNDIEGNNVQFVSPQRKAFQMLLKWSHRKEIFSYGTLSQALKKEGNTEVAVKYCGDHQSVGCAEQEQGPPVISLSPRRSRKRSTDTDPSSSSTPPKLRVKETSTNTASQVRDDLIKIKEWALVTRKTGLQDLRVNARQKGYHLHQDNPGGGNCMFHALLDQLRRLGSREMSEPQMVREKLVDYLERNPTLDDGTKLFGFVSGYPSWSDYLDGMRRDGTWGDHLILLAAANLFQRPIVIITSLPHNEKIVIKPSKVSAGQVADDPIVLGHVAELHYVSLEPEDGMPTKPEVKIPAKVEQKKSSSGEEPATHRSMYVDAEGWTVFHLACAKGNVALIKVQLQNVMDINHRTNSGETPLLLAARSGNLEAVRLLLSEDADLHAVDYDGNNALHMACVSGDVQTIDFFLNKEFELESVGSQGMTPLLIAVYNGELNAVKFLADKGANIDAETAAGLTAAHWAAQSGDVNTLKLLHTNGFHMNQKMVNGKTPAMVAVEFGKDEAAEYLLSLTGEGAPNDRSMDVDAKGCTVFHYACIKGNVQLIRQLLNGVDINHRTNDGGTPLLFAAQFGHVEAVRLLLSKGADINAKADGLTVAHYAALSGDVATLKLLKAEGCRMNRADDSGKTPAIIALAAGNDGAAEYLLSLTGV